MVKITKNEKDAVLQAFPGAHIRRTMKSKSDRHKYYCEESERVMCFLDKFRRSQIVIA